MATDKVMITISGLQDHEVILASDGRLEKALHQVDLFQAAEGAPGESACAVMPAPGEPAKASPEAAESVTAGKAPWELASGDPTAINFRPDMPLHAKMEWVCENVPKMSRLRILREGAELLCNMLIEKHYRNQG